MKETRRSRGRDWRRRKDGMKLRCNTNEKSNEVFLFEKFMQLCHLFIISICRYVVVEMISFFIRIYWRVNKSYEGGDVLFGNVNERNREFQIFASNLNVFEWFENVTNVFSSELYFCSVYKWFELRSISMFVKDLMFLGEKLNRSCSWGLFSRKSFANELNLWSESNFHWIWGFKKTENWNQWTNCSRKSSFLGNNCSRMK